MLMELLSSCLELSPIHASLLQVFDSILQNLLLTDQLRDFIHGVFASEFLQDLKSVSQVFILIL